MGEIKIATGDGVIEVARNIIWVEALTELEVTKLVSEIESSSM
jgi:hypothetical protein